MKKTFALILCLFMCFCIFNVSVFAAQDFTCNEPFTGNTYSHSYHFYADVIKSYLVDCSDNTLMRFQYDSNNSLMIAEYYSYDYEFIRGKIIPEELPLFGGFYASDDYYFILTGMNNPNESASVECFRITKYDKNWNRITSAGLYDCDTMAPFSQGSARFVQCEEQLLVRTSHTMYKSYDGINHQSNISIELNMNTMKISSDTYGYVSHSVNQFIKTDNDNIITIDHGDGYPRSIVLYQYNKDFDTIYPVSTTDMLSISGDIGEYYTGCTVGGLEVSDDAYIVVGTSIVQSEFYDSNRVQNVYVSSLSKDTNEITFNFITDFDDNSIPNDVIRHSVPFLIKLSNTDFLLMWENDSTVFYTKLDSSGSLKGEIYEMQGELSDCEPIIINGKVIWYVYRNSTIDFYTISADNLSETEKNSVYRGHEYELLSAQGSFAHVYCTKCSTEKTGNVPETYSILNAIPPEYSLTRLKAYHTATVNDTLIVFGRYDIGASTDITYSEFTISDPSVAVIQKTEYRIGETMYHVKFLKEGTVKLRYSSTCLPEYGFTSTIEVSHSTSVISVDKEPTCTENGLQTVICSCCEKTSTEEIPAKGHTEVTIFGKSATCTESGLTDGSICSVCDTVIKEQEVIEKLAHTAVTVTGNDATCTETGFTDGVKCFVCDAVIVAQEEVPVTGHTEVTVTGNDATCTETGLTDGVKCFVCDAVIVAQEEIPATGHSFGEWAVVKAPTNTEAGSEERDCSVCGEKETRVIEKLSYIAGDVNGDGKITAADARIVLRISAKLDNLEDYNLPLEALDVTGDGKLTAADARKVLRISAKLEN